MSLRHKQQRHDTLDTIAEHLRDAIEIAREGDGSRDVQIRIHLALAIQDIDNLRGEHYEDYI
jgi:hypothetical protein|tara:strand:+ start:433 stop:618 length:186 start_codon:yes stop_codon:yes gene_type:complete